MIDAHAHLSAPSIAKVVDRVVARLRAGGLTGVVLGGVDPADWQRQSLLCTAYPKFIVSSAGIHPWVVREASDGDLLAQLDQLRTAAGNVKLVGEMGLDFYRDNSPSQKAKQVHWCEEQLKIAQSVGKPVILHVVKGHDQMLRILDKYPGVRGLMHGFSGGADLGREYGRRGFVISLGARFLRRQSVEDLRWLEQWPFVLESDAPEYGDNDLDPVAVADAWLDDLRFSAAHVANACAVSESEVWLRSDKNIGELVGVGDF